MVLAGCVRSAGGVGLLSSERVDVKQAGALAQNRDAVLVVPPAVSGMSGPDIEQAVERPGPDTAVGREEIWRAGRQGARGLGVLVTLIAGRCGTVQTDGEAAGALEALGESGVVRSVAEGKRDGVVAPEMFGQAGVGIGGERAEADIGPLGDQTQSGETGSLPRVTGVGDARLNLVRVTLGQLRGIAGAGGKPEGQKQPREIAPWLQQNACAFKRESRPNRQKPQLAGRRKLPPESGKFGRFWASAFCTAKNSAA